MAGLSAPLSAIERPKSLDDEAPSARPAQREAAQAQGVEQEEAPKNGVEVAPPAQGQAAAWLGVLSEPIDETLGMHLDLATGVVLSYVAQDSPAAAAGLQRHDVIAKVDGRAIGSQDELRDEMQAHQPGDEVTLDTISRGQPVERKVKLGERPAAVPALPPGAQLEPGAGLRGLADRLPGLKGQMKGLEGLLPGGGEEFQKQLEGHMKRLEKELRELEKGPGGHLKMDFGLLDNFENLPKPQNGRGGFNLEFKSSSSFKFLDDEGSIEMKTQDGSQEAVVRDKAGEILFEGPWETEQDKAAAPEAIRQRIEEKINRNRFNFRLENLPEPEMELPDVEKPKPE
jgi:hypothetical protein